MRVFLVCLCVFMGLSFPLPLKAAPKPSPLGPVLKANTEESHIELALKGARLLIEPLSDGLFRVTLQTKETLEPKPSYAVIDPPNPISQEASIEENEGSLVVENSSTFLEIDKQKGTLSLKDSNGNPDILDLTFMGLDTPKGFWTGFSFPCSEHTSFYGLGEKTGPLDKTHQTLTMWNTDAFGYDVSTDPLYQSHPFLILLTPQARAVGLFLDSPALSKFELNTRDSSRVSVVHASEDLTLYLIPGPSIKEVVNRYTALTGRMPMPPLWAIGHMISRLAWNPAQAIPEIGERARSERIPLDALWLDMYYMDAYKDFTWNQNTFPDFPGFLENLHSQGYHTVGIIHPAIKLDPTYGVYQEGLKLDAFVKRQDGSLYRGRLWPGTSVWPDFTRPDVRKWWGGLYKGLIEAGLDGFWNDMNEPSVFDPHTFENALKTFPEDVVLYDYGRFMPHTQIHNAYGMLMARASYEGIARLMGGKRPFLLSRAGFSGIQRYAAVWTGDNTSNFAHLSLQNPMLLNMGLSGLAFSGADIGGFAGSATPELLVRWYTASTFMPLMREHADQFALPQEPWAFGEPYTSMIRKTIELRYRLLPYLYSLFYIAHTTGLPVLRPLVMEYQKDPASRGLSGEFLVGEHLLVAPVTEPKAQAKSLYLPEGVWYELESRGIRQGNQWVTKKAPLGDLPVFVKEGAVIPSVEPQLSTQGLLRKPIRLELYPLIRSLRSESLLVLDDGESLEGDRQVFRFIQQREPSGITLDIERSGGSLYGHSSFEVHVYGEMPERILIDGTTVLPTTSEEGFEFSLPASAQRVEVVF